MKKAFMGLVSGFFAVAFSVFGGEESELLKAAGEQYESLFKSSFTVKMISAEIGGLLSKAVSEKSAKAGFPLVIKIKDFVLTSKDGKMDCAVELDVPDEGMRAMMEEQANTLLKNGGFSQALADLTLGALRQAAEYAKDNADSMTLVGQNDKAARFSIDNPEGTLFGKLSVTKATMDVNKEYKIIPAVRFDLSDGSAAYAQLIHNMVDVHACPTRISIKHNLKVAPAGQRLPGVITVAFTDYVFD